MSYKFCVPGGFGSKKILVGKALIKAPHGNFSGEAFLVLNHQDKAMWWSGGNSGMIAQFKLGDGRFVEATINPIEDFQKSQWGFEGKWYIGVPIAKYTVGGDYDGRTHFCSPLVLTPDGDQVIAKANEKLDASAGIPVRG